jgi:hypothetical protein
MHVGVYLHAEGMMQASEKVTCCDDLREQDVGIFSITVS